MMIFYWERLERISKVQPKTPGYYELKQIKLQFNEICLKLLEQRKQIILQWLQDPSQINGENLKEKINQPATHHQTRNITDLHISIKKFEGYQPRNNLVKDMNDDMLADSQNILSMWKNYFAHLLTVERVVMFGKWNYSYSVST